MYDRGVTRQRIEAEIALTSHEVDPLDRFDGVYHTVEEVDAFIAHANRLIDEDGDFTRQFTKTERQWIRNERILCLLDFVYWATRYAKIINFKNQLVHFVPNIAQRIVIDIWADMERDGVAILMLQLKARQAGMSTITELAVEHRVQFYSDVNAVVASCEDDKSAKMVGMIELSFAHQPWFLMPNNTSHKIGKLLRFNNGSSISVESGNQTTGIAMGTTPQVAHMSEVSKVRNAEMLIEQSLLRAVHEDPFTFVVLESTADGFDNWFYRTWVDASTYYPQGKSTLFPFFLPWFVARDIYPTQAWVKKHPIPEGWVPTELTQKHAERAAIAVGSNDRLRRILGDDWRMDVEQQWYYELKYEEAVRTKSLNLFLSEMPADPDEAFQTSNVTVVDPMTVKAYRERALANVPQRVFAITGSSDELPQSKYTVSSRLWDKTKQPFTLDTYVGNVISTYKFTPLIFEGYDADPNNKFFMWEAPKDGEEYGLGVDTGDGVDQDSSVIEVWKRSTIWEPWTQVGEFASSYMNASDFWPIVQAIATLYSVIRQGNLRQPKLIIECRGTGDLVQNELRKRGWSNFHIPVRIDKKKIDPSRQHYMGVMTSQWLRKSMIDKFLSMFNSDELVIQSPWLLREIARLEVDEKKIQAASGAHDDRVLASCFVLLSLDVIQMNPRVRRREGPASEDPVYVDPQSRSFDGRSVKSLSVETRFDAPAIARQRF